MPLSSNAVLEELLRRISKMDGNVSAMAKKLGVHRTTLYKIISGDRGIGEDLAKKLGFYRGYSKSGGYKKAAKTVYS